MTKLNILRNGMLDLTLLSQALQKPSLFAPGEPLFWDDPHISQQMLDAHLDPDKDAASRRHDLIDQQVSWIAELLPLHRGSRLLDLGCGPGLYCTRLGRLGYQMTGIDYSRRSIEYARHTADENHQTIEYVYQDYLTLNLVARFDAAIMVYYDFGVLSDGDRDNLLRRIHRALKPEGRFLFDLLTPVSHPAQAPVECTVKPDGGFWRPGPHLVLSQTLGYPEADTYLDQYAVAEPSGETTIYRIWQRCYTPETITTALEACGFVVEGIWADLTGRAYQPGEKTLAVMARKVDKDQ